MILPGLKENAGRSCEITHANREAIEGTKAIALAAAFAVREKMGMEKLDHQDFIRSIQSELSDSDLKSKLNKCLYLDGNPGTEVLVKTLGNGTGMTAQDTVPLVIWMLSRYRYDLEECLWNTVSALGDRDTTCAMAGGVSILCCKEGTVPEWTVTIENWKKKQIL